MNHEYEDFELYHHGVLGMRWGHRKQEYKSGKKKGYSFRGRMAARKNRKVDAGFDRWKQQDKAKSRAIEAGKKKNVLEMQIQDSVWKNGKIERDLLKEKKFADKAFKKSLKELSTYRKGSVKSEVGKDLSRQYLSRSKKILKELNSDPSNKALKTEYKAMVDQYNIERSKARKAQEVGANRSYKIASMKRKARSAAIGAGAIAGTYAAVKILEKKGVINLSDINIQNAASRGVDAMYKIRRMGGFIY